MKIFVYSACRFYVVQIDSHFSYGFYLSLPWQTVRRKWETSGAIDNSVFDSFTLRGLSAFLYACRGLSVFPAGRDDSDKKFLIVWWMARGDEKQGTTNTELNFRLQEGRENLGYGVVNFHHVAHYDKRNIHNIMYTIIICIRVLLSNYITYTCM